MIKIFKDDIMMNFGFSPSFDKIKSFRKLTTTWNKEVAKLKTHLIPSSLKGFVSLNTRRHRQLAPQTLGSLGTLILTLYTFMVHLLCFLISDLFCSSWFLLIMVSCHIYSWAFSIYLNKLNIFYKLCAILERKNKAYG